MLPDSLDEEFASVTRSGLVEGSRFDVRAPDGALVTSAPVVGGSATVSVPRSLGPGFLSLLMLRVPLAGVDVPWQPDYGDLKLPQATTPTAAVDRRFAPTGTSVLASGHCDGIADVVVEGQPEWFDDPPAVYVSRVLAGTWSVRFPMPPEPSLLRVRCAVGDVVEGATVILAPSDGPTVPTVVSPDPDGPGWLVEAPLCSGWFLGDLPVDAFAADGSRVPVERVGEWTYRFAGDPGPVVLLGPEQFMDENASALRDGKPQACRADLPAAAVDEPPLVAREPQARAVAGAELPATGGTPLLPAGATLVVLGVLLVRGARRRAGQGSGCQSGW